MISKPEWLHIRHSNSQDREAVEELLKNLNLNTVCREANCPNAYECFTRKTATFMILGTNCTRICPFCNVSNGEPLQIDLNEPRNIAEAVKTLGLKYVVVTSVTRDDLPDGGAEHFAKVILEIKKTTKDVAVEVLIPDFMGDNDSLKTVVRAFPNVISHNVETVKSLYPEVRPQASYERTLKVLRNIREFGEGKIHSKSGVMLGMGETEAELYMLFDDLLENGCEFLTIGQYLAPSKRHFPVHDYIEPEKFEKYGEIARQKGFAFVSSAPLVRSSYHADEALKTE